MQIVETPAFTKLKEQSAEARQPIVEVIRTYPREVLLAMGHAWPRTARSTSTAHSSRYWTQQLNSRTVILNAMLVAAICELGAIPFLRRAVGSLGRRPVYLFGAIMTALLAFPLFWLLDRIGPAHDARCSSSSCSPTRRCMAAGGVSVGDVRHARALQRSVARRAARSVLAGAVADIAAAPATSYGRTAVRCTSSSWPGHDRRRVAASETHREDIE
jgi:hypothetical protein